jgi:propane monooxygenase coupling protein
MSQSEDNQMMNRGQTMKTHAKYTFDFKREPSNLCGVTLSAGVEGNAIAELMSKKPGVKITHYPAIIRIDGEKMLEFDMEEIGAALGYDPGEYGVYDFEVETSTHYGRQVRFDDKVLLFARPEDAAEYLGFELPETKQAH